MAATNDDILLALNSIVEELRRNNNSSSYYDSANPTGSASMKDFSGKDESNIRLQRAAQKLKQEEFKNMKKFVGDLKKINKDQELEKVINQTSRALSYHTESFTRSFKTAEKEMAFWQSQSGENLKHLSTRIAANERRMASLDKTSARYQAMLSQQIKLQEQYAEILEESMAANKAETKSKGELIETTHKLKGVFGKLVNVGKAVYGDTMTRLKYASQQTIGELQLWSLQTGSSAEQLAKLSSQSRQTFNAMGGSEQAFALMKSEMFDLTKITGDLKQNGAFVANQLDYLAKNGIRPNVVEYEKSKRYLSDFRRLTGMTAEQFQQMNSRLSDNVGVRRTIAALDKQQRGEYLLSLQAQIKNRIALGMTTEQAIKASETLAEMAGKGAKDRITEGAKLAAFAASQGIAGASEVQALVIKGQRRTADETERLRQIMTELGNASARAGTASIGQELMLNSVMESLGVAQDQVEKFGMTTAEARVVDQNAVEKTADEQMGKVADLLLKAGIALEAGSTFFNDKVVTALWAITGALALPKAAKLAGGAVSKLGGAVSTAGGWLGNTAKTVGSRALGLAGPTAAVVGSGAAGYAAGTYAYDNSEAVRDVMSRIAFGVDNVFAMLGNDNAQARVDAINAAGGISAFDEYEADPTTRKETRERQNEKMEQLADNASSQLTVQEALLQKQEEQKGVLEQILGALVGQQEQVLPTPANNPTGYNLNGQ